MDSDKDIVANYIETTTPPLDSDNDGIPNSQDNCPYIANYDQTDSNNNGVGDACETQPQPDIPSELYGINIWYIVAAICGIIAVIVVVKLWK